MVVHAYYPLAETRVEREALALIDAGIEVDVICLRDTNDLPSERLKDVQIYRMPVRRHKSSGAAVQLFEYLLFFFYASIFLAWQHLRKRYKVVQLHNLPDFLVFAAIFPKLTGAKVILDIHDLMPDFFAEKFEKPLDSFPVRLVRWQEKVSCWFADHVITVTEIWRQSLINQGIPAEKISVVMNLADHRIFKPIAKLDLPTREREQFRLIYHGYIPERYGLDLVLKAIDELKDKIPEIFFSLIGDGEYLPELKRMSDQMGLTGKHVEFVPYVPVDQLPALIAAADLAVVPYRNDVFTDALLPTKLLEYALMGLPTIAARTSTIAYYFDESMVEFFTPGNGEEFTEAIKRLFFDPQRRTELAEGIQQFNQNYNWENSSREYANLVLQLPQKANKNSKNQNANTGEETHKNLNYGE
ncbi:glycosyltransferase family 4 protein [bacterium]|nr:glycosyltransferase family 4 protein [bacterium]